MYPFTFRGTSGIRGRSDRLYVFPGAGRCYDFIWFSSQTGQGNVQAADRVNGIGPKGALGILSIMRPDDLRIAIVSGDAKAISKAPGIGAKTAQRLILDLKDKVDLEEVMIGFLGRRKGRLLPVLVQAHLWQVWQQLQKRQWQL